ncbi:hypothetical protein BT93_E2239 [Corymbia citriodora subsp. variegata]|nr:hypothetical protein BT93_E2239 [Corymbia citriodora subsp. variegata]
MHRLVFGLSFAELVAPILLLGFALYFLNKKKASVCRNAEDADTGASGSLTVPTEANSVGSNSSRTTTSGGFSSSPTEAKSGGSSPSPTETNLGASSLSLYSAETSSSGSSLPPSKINNSATSSSLTDSKSSASSSSLSPTETNSDGSSSSSTKTNNGASSSLTGNCYEVFLSFRGADTRHGFTDHLYNGLVNAGIHTFRDDDELSQGENIRPKLMEAITSSKILIPILSVTYGASSWCLDELVQIMERKDNNGQIVLPIFYKVKPADVRHQIGGFGDAFHERERRLRGRPFDPTILEKWKKALNEVSALKGYEANGYEAKLVQEVVQKALSELKKKFELVISENLVGIDRHVNKILDVDTKSNATLFIGIHGMGGIGKTTLAKIIYNKLSSQFEHRSFIADIRESWKRNGVHYIQNQLIHDILKQENEVRNEDEGTKFISSRFKGKKVLILLDDVDEVIHLKRLAGNHDWFSSGSRIIITTRNKGVFEEARVDYNYEHKVLDNNQSLILFSKHAFRKDSPLKEFEDLTRDVVSITKGLPLSLEVLGSLLCGKKLAFWRGTIDKLKKVPPKEVREKLRISIDALEYEQKQIFLDIAYFFIGTDKNIAFYMWDACDFFPGEGIEILIFRSLIKVGNNDELIMHDQLRDLGREIVHEEDRREPWCRSRLWDYEEVQNMLKSNKVTVSFLFLFSLCSTVKSNVGPLLSACSSGPETFTITALESFTNVIRK